MNEGDRFGKRKSYCEFLLFITKLEEIEVKLFRELYQKNRVVLKMNLPQKFQLMMPDRLTLKINTYSKKAY